jgi:hypothetical protein
MNWLLPTPRHIAHHAISSSLTVVLSVEARRQLQAMMVRLVAAAGAQLRGGVSGCMGTVTSCSDGIISDRERVTVLELIQGCYSP